MRRCRRSLAVEADPLAFFAVAGFGDGISVRIVDMEAVDAEAYMPGEVSGPGAAISLEITNGSATDLDLDMLPVDPVNAADRSATLITSRETVAHSGTLAAGASAEGTYLFTIAVDDRSDVSLRVNNLASEPTVVFEGSLAHA
jgi:hypothetical protein